MIEPKMIQVRLNGERVGEHIDQGNHVANLAESKKVLAAAGFDPDAKTPHLTVLGQARNFRETVRMIYQLGFSRSPFNPYFVAPLAVNLGFCLEIYLKALGSANGITLHGHKLVKLFGELPAHAQQSIATTFQQELAERKIANADLQNTLAEMNSAFEDWRYVYEEGKSFGFDVLCALALVDTLEKVARQGDNNTA